MLNCSFIDLWYNTDNIFSSTNKIKQFYFFKVIIYSMSVEDNFR